MSSLSSLFGNLTPITPQQQQHSGNRSADPAFSALSSTRPSPDLNPLPDTFRQQKLTLPAPAHPNNTVSAKMQRAHFWSTVLNVSDPRELSPGSSVSTDRGSQYHSPVPEMKIPRGLNISGLPLDALNQLAAADLRRGRRWRTPRKGARPGPFRCETCWSSFGQRGDLMRHIRVTHLGERNYHCTVCSMSFGRRSILNKHVKRHERDGAAPHSPRSGVSTRAPRTVRSGKKSSDAAGVLRDIMQDRRY